MISEFTEVLVDTASYLYVDPTLSYHNWDHIQHMLAAHRTLFGRHAITEEEMLAIAFHDVVYVPGAGPGVNEDLSKIVFQRHHDALCKRWGMEAFIDCDLVKGMIDATKVANHLDPQLRFTSELIPRVLDCDLAGLGSSYSSFVERQDSIIFEYAGELSTKEHQAGRVTSANFLRQFLAKPRIFLTDEGFAAFEEQARANIERYVEENA